MIDLTFCFMALAVIYSFCLASCVDPYCTLHLCSDFRALLLALRPLFPSQSQQQWYDISQNLYFLPPVDTTLPVCSGGRSRVLSPEYVTLYLMDTI